jgi:hypothetical protein
MRIEKSFIGFYNSSLVKMNRVLSTFDIILLCLYIQMTFISYIVSDLYRLLYFV